MLQENRTYQQQLVWEKLDEGLQSLEEANQSLETKASRLVAGSTGAITTIAGVNFLPSVELNNSGAVVLMLLCLTVIVMFWFAARLWGPRPVALSVTSDVKVLYEQYIAKKEDVAFNNALIDRARALECSKWVNERKSEELRHMLIVLQAQVLLLGIGVLCRTFL